MRGHKPTFSRQPQPPVYEAEDHSAYRFDWVATSWRPDPITMTAREVVIGRGYSTRKDTINILFEALPIADQDNFCRVILRPADHSPLDEEWIQNWTVLSYRTDRNGATKKNVLGGGWIEDNEILVCLDALPTPNQNVECWVALKPKIERLKYETKQADF
jgi:hypothetical protein